MKSYEPTSGHKNTDVIPTYSIKWKNFKWMPVNAESQTIAYSPRLQISASHRTFVHQIWGFHRETVQSDWTHWQVSPVKMVISLKKANFNIWLLWLWLSFILICVHWKLSLHWIENMPLPSIFMQFRLHKSHPLFIEIDTLHNIAHKL